MCAAISRPRAPSTIPTARRSSVRTPRTPGDHHAPPTAAPLDPPAPGGAVLCRPVAGHLLYRLALVQRGGLPAGVHRDADGADDALYNRLRDRGALAQREPASGSRLGRRLPANP